MILSATCQYAIRALVFLALHEGPRPVLARDIAAAQEIPRQFLAKILHHLRQKGLVRSQKGPGGGFLLGRPASRITMGEVVSAVDGTPGPIKTCILGRHDCNDHSGCALHEVWSRFQAQYEQTIGALTLEEVARSLEKKRAPAPATSPAPPRPTD